MIKKKIKNIKFKKRMAVFLDRDGTLNKTYIKTPSLIELYSTLFPTSIIPSNLHNSLIDILCTFRCYIKMAHNIDIIEYNITVKNLFIN